MALLQTPCCYQFKLRLAAVRTVPKPDWRKVEKKHTPPERPSLTVYNPYQCNLEAAFFIFTNLHFKNIICKLAAHAVGIAFKARLR